MIYGDEPMGYGEVNRAQKELMGQLLSNPNYNDLIPDLNSILQSGNLYAYCMNNPVAYTDPSGEALLEAVTTGIAGTLAKTLICVLAAVGVVVVSFAMADAISEFVEDSKRNNSIFYAVEGNKLSRGKMKEISAGQALERVLSGQNVYTESQNAACMLARIASLGAEPVHDNLTYNAHYHLHGRQNRAHIYYGFVR